MQVSIYKFRISLKHVEVIQELLSNLIHRLRLAYATWSATCAYAPPTPPREMPTSSYIHHFQCQPPDKSVQFFTSTLKKICSCGSLTFLNFNQTPTTHNSPMHPRTKKNPSVEWDPRTLGNSTSTKKCSNNLQERSIKKGTMHIYIYIYTHHISKYINTPRYKWLRIKKHQPGNCANMWPFWGVWFSRDPKKNWVVVVVGDLQIGNRSSWVTAAESPGSWSYLSGLKKNKQTHPKKTDP